MIDQARRFLKKAVGFVLNIGADPRDSEYIRLIKRIYFVAAAFGYLASAASTGQLSQKIIGDVQDFATGTEPCDDITLVIIKRAGEYPPEAHR